jgi:hypothetical protein
LFGNVTLMFVAPFTTCAFVTTSPSALMMMPVPAPSAWKPPKPPNPPRPFPDVVTVSLMMTTDGSIFASADFTLDETCDADGKFETDVDDAAGVALALPWLLSSMVWTTAPVAAAEMTTAATTAPVCRSHGRFRLGAAGAAEVCSAGCVAAAGSGVQDAAGDDDEDGAADHHGIGSGTAAGVESAAGPAVGSGVGSGVGAAAASGVVASGVAASGVGSGVCSSSLS